MIPVLCSSEHPRLPLLYIVNSPNVTIVPSYGPLGTLVRKSNYEGLLAPQLQEDIDNGAEEWTPTDPDRFDNEDLIEREAAMGRSNFMLQFMLDTSLSDPEKFPLKCSDLVVTSVNPSTAPDSVVWCSDPANVIKDATNCWTTWRLFLQSNAVTRRLEPLHRDNLLN